MYTVFAWAAYAPRARQILTLERENLMIQKLSLALAMTTLLASNAFAEVHEVQMLNRTADAKMAFEPAFLQIAEGDSVKFLAKDRGHNAETIAGMTPEETAGFKGKINEEIEVMFDTAGLYGIKCKPHFAMGMVMTIAVGEVLEVPESFFKGRISKKPKARFEEQIANLNIAK